MKSQNNWVETKFAIVNGKLQANRKNSRLSPHSWLISECVAELYSKYLPLYTSGPVLDLGCGMCPLYGVYQKYSSSVICIDWENSLHPNPYNDLICDISKPIPLRNGLFDTIILSDVLEHLPNPSHLLDEVFRLLKAKGILISNVPFFYWLHETPHDYYRYTEFALVNLLQEAGLTIEVLEVVGGVLETWVDLTSKITAHLPVLRYIASIGFFKIMRRLRKQQQIKNKLIYLDRSFPTGYFVVARKL